MGMGQARIPEKSEVWITRGYTSETLLPPLPPFRACSTQTWIRWPSESPAGYHLWSLLMPLPSMRWLFEGKPLLQISLAGGSQLSITPSPFQPLSWKKKALWDRNEP